MTASACGSATGAATAPRGAATWSPTPSSRSAGAGTSWAGTSRATTGGRSASTASPSPSLAGRRFAPRELPGGDAAAYVAAGRWEATGRHTAVVTVHLPAEELRRRFGAGWGAVTPIDDATCEFRTGDDDLRWLALRLAMIDAEMEVRDPPELRDRLRDLAARLGRAAGPSEADQAAGAISENSDA